MTTVTSIVYFYEYNYNEAMLPNKSLIIAC